MGVKPGFKQTEVGVIPEEWESRQLGDFAAFRTGPFGSALHKSDYTRDGIPVVNPMHIVNGQIEPTRTMTITEDAAAGLSEFRLKAGEIVIGRRGDMGRCAVVQPLQSGWLCGTGSMIIRCDGGLHVEFLRRVLSSPSAIAAIEDSSVGTTMTNLNQGVLGGLRIQVPPLPEQRAIAEALSDVDALLGALDRLIAKKRDLKQAAMQQLLTGQTRLPGFAPGRSRFRQTAAGSIPEDWEVKSFAELFSFRNGVNADKGSYGQGVRFVNVLEPITYSHIYGREVTGHVMLPEAVVESYALRRGDLIFNRTSETQEEVGLAAAYLGTERVVFGGFVIRGRPLKQDLDPTYSGYAFRAPAIRSQIIPMGQGAIRANLGQENLRQVVAALPALPEQAAIAGVLSDMDAELTALESRREKTRALKQGMMQELLTGRVRLV